MNGSDITADGDGHFDRQGHEQEAQGAAPRGWDKVDTSTESLAHEEPPTVTTEYPTRNHIRIIGKNDEGYVLEIKRNAYSSESMLIVMSAPAARQLMENLFKTLL